MRCIISIVEGKGKGKKRRFRKKDPILIRFNDEISCNSILTSPGIAESYRQKQDEIKKKKRMVSTASGTGAEWTLSPLSQYEMLISCTE